jgi:hypothetical protein
MRRRILAQPRVRLSQALVSDKIRGRAKFFIRKLSCSSSSSSSRRKTLQTACVGRKELVVQLPFVVLQCRGRFGVQPHFSLPFAASYIEELTKLHVGEESDVRALPSEWFQMHIVGHRTQRLQHLRLRCNDVACIAPRFIIVSAAVACCTTCVLIQLKAGCDRRGTVCTQQIGRR